MSAPALLCAGVEIALNRYLQLERPALAECAALAGRSIALTALDFGWTFVVEPHAGGVRVLGEPAAEPDVRVSAPSLRLLRLAMESASGRGGGLPAGLTVEGDQDLLRRFGLMLARVGFDPEELAARFVGDGAAHRLVGGLRSFFGWGRQAADRLSQDTAEFLSEETEDLARSGDVHEWMDAVDTLREDADRFEARLALLEQQVTENQR